MREYATIGWCCLRWEFSLMPPSLAFEWRPTMNHRELQTARLGEPSRIESIPAHCLQRMQSDILGRWMFELPVGSDESTQSNQWLKALFQCLVGVERFLTERSRPLSVRICCELYAASIPALMLGADEGLHGLSKVRVALSPAEHWWQPLQPSREWSRES